jgi:hypothetical protein
VYGEHAAPRLCIAGDYAVVGTWLRRGISTRAARVAACPGAVTRWSLAGALGIGSGFWFGRGRTGDSEEETGENDGSV